MKKKKNTSIETKMNEITHTHEQHNEMEENPFITQRIDNDHANGSYPGASIQNIRVKRCNIMKISKEQIFILFFSLSTEKKDREKEKCMDSILENENSIKISLQNKIRFSQKLKNGKKFH